MKIHVLMITHNRPVYTEQSLRALCDSMPEGGKIVVWDNASDEKTKSVLARFAKESCIAEIVHNPSNEKLRGPINWFWKNYGQADLIGKVDDDCVVPTNWCEKLACAHREIPEAGVLACWHFLPEDLNQTNAERKVVKYGEHKVMRNCWVGGSGYLFKRQMLEHLGLLGEDESFTDYCMRAAVQGYINGWYYPFLYQQHLDDPRWEDTAFKTDEDFVKSRPLSAQNFGVESRAAWIDRMKGNAQMLQNCSFDPGDYVGWVPKIRRKVFGLLGKKYIPGVTTK